jgi:hypothetical protein
VNFVYRFEWRMSTNERGHSVDGKDFAPGVQGMAYVGS